jgi:hypothetical protein
MSHHRKCPLCDLTDLFIGEAICPDCLEPEDHDD